MEINTYTLKQKNDEFKDLTENQLMAIAELCMDYYKMALKSLEEDTNSDLQDQVDELTNEIEDLESKIDCYETMQDDLYDLIQDCYKSQDKQEIQDNIEDFAQSHKYEYVWDFINKNDNNSK